MTRATAIYYAPIRRKMLEVMGYTKAHLYLWERLHRYGTISNIEYYRWERWLVENLIT